MPDSITLKIADLTVDVQYENKRIADLCRDYVVCGKEPDIKVVYDQKKCEDESMASGFGMAAAEFSCIYRQIAEVLPYHSRAVMHGAVISYKEKAYMFIAKSGTGKTTHINLWREFFGGVKVINGDKPVIAADGKNIIAYGTPWAGKEGLQENTSAPLCGICLLKQGKENCIRKLDSNAAFKAIIRQVFLPESAESLNLTMNLIDDIIRYVPFYELTCDISREAAECSFTALTGEKI